MIHFSGFFFSPSPCVHLSAKSFHIRGCWKNKEWKYKAGIKAGDRKPPVFFVYVAPKRQFFPLTSHINIQLSVHHGYVSLLCGLSPALLKIRFIQRINTLTFGRFEGKKKKKSPCTILALQQQQQQLRATRRVKSIVPFSVHSCLGRHGDSSGDPNMKPQSKKKKKERRKSALLLYKPYTG